MGKGDQHHRGHQKRFNAHIHKAGDGTGRIVGVDGAQDPVSGQGCLHGDVGCLAIPDLPYHDDIGVLAQNGAQAARKRHPGLAVQLDLADFFNAVLHRIFDRYNIDVRLIDPFQDGIEAGAFAASGGAGAENHAVRLEDNRLDLAAVFVHHPQGFQRVDARTGIQQA